MSTNPSVADLQAQIAASRERLAEVAKARFAAATTTPTGDLRTERLAAVAAAFVVLMVVRRLLKRRRA